MTTDALATPPRDALREPDLCDLHGLSLAVELCADAMNGLCDADLARRAMPTLAKLLRAEVDKLAKVAA